MWGACRSVGWNVEVAEGRGGCRDWCACLSPSAAGVGNYSWERCPQRDASCQWDCPGRQRQTAPRAESQHSSLGLGQQRHQHLPVSRWATAGPHCLKERERGRDGASACKLSHTVTVWTGDLMQFGHSYFSFHKHELPFLSLSSHARQIFRKSPRVIFQSDMCTESCSSCSL